MAPIYKIWLRKYKVIVGVISLLLLMQFTLVLPVSGITNPTPDMENKYPYVGLFAIDRLDGQGLQLGCSGTLIAPDVFLTAAHCSGWKRLYPDSKIYVSLDQRINEGGVGNEWILAEEFILHPLWGHDLGNFYDLAVILLTEPVYLSKMPTLTPAGLLDDLSAHGDLKGVDFTMIGYGDQADWEQGPVRFWWDGWRNYAPAPLMALTPPAIFLNINEHATDGGGACFGDSGGPLLLPTANGETLVGVSSRLADMNCRAMTTYYRIDTSWAQEFLSQFVTLP